MHNFFLPHYFLIITILINILLTKVGCLSNFNKTPKIQYHRFSSVNLTLKIFFSRNKLLASGLGNGQG